MKKCHPLQDRVLVRVADAVEKSAGGIIIPDSAQKKPAIGVVVEVGPGRWTPTDHGPVHSVPEVQVGSKVLYGKYSGVELSIEGKDHVLLREEELLGIVED